MSTGHRARFASVTDMAWWLAGSIAAGTAGVLVVAVCVFAVFRQLVRLGDELDRTRRLLLPKQAVLQRELDDLQAAMEAQDQPDDVRST